MGVDRKLDTKTLQSMLFCDLDVRVRLLRKFSRENLTPSLIFVLDTYVYSDSVIRVNYWVDPGEILTHDIKLEDYINTNRERRLIKIGI